MTIQVKRLAIARVVYDALLRAARAAAPLEACGLLAGHDDRVVQFYPLANADASPEHFSMLPAEQFAAVKDMRRRGLRLLAIWHSHPASPARMSAEDLRLAFTPDVAYVILSLVTPDAPVLGGYALRDGAAEPMPILIEGQPS